MIIRIKLFEFLWLLEKDQKEEIFLKVPNDFSKKDEFLKPESTPESTYAV